MTLAVLVFGPFALVYAFAFFGFNFATFPTFGAWFMLALSACGLFTFVDLVVTGIRSRRVEWVLLVIVGVATCWWVWIAIKPFL